jgi:hypothetical protein
MKLNIYIIHAQWQKDRERVIDSIKAVAPRLKVNHITDVNIRVISEFDYGEINQQLASRMLNQGPIQDSELAKYNSLIGTIHISQFSNTLKHYRALELISINSGESDINLVLEDDVLFEESVGAALDKIVGLSTHPIVFLGMPNNLKEAPGKGTFQFIKTKEVFQVLPYCDSYIITKKTAHQMHTNFLPIKFQNNVQMSFVMDKLKIASYLTAPNIFMDGSKFGAFLSGLSPTNELVFNPDYVKAKELLSKDLNSRDITTLEKLWKESPIREHPDMLHQKVLYLAKINKKEDAKKLCEELLKIFQGNNCIVNRDSKFLRDYINLYQPVDCDV